MTARKVVSAKQKYKTKPARLNLKLGNKPILWAELKARQKSCAQSHARKYPPTKTQDPALEILFTALELL